MPPSFSSCMVPLPLSSSRLRTRHPFDNTDKRSPCAAVDSSAGPSGSWILLATTPRFVNQNIPHVAAQFGRPCANSGSLGLSRTPRRQRRIEREQRFEQILSVSEGRGQLPRAALRCSA
jgi:hypothetical protein